MNIIIREYVSIINEFRCYFHDGILRAISGLKQGFDINEKIKIINFVRRAQYFS
jgi:hypothetical protein